jgi:uncharacterized protein
MTKQASICSVLLGVVLVMPAWADFAAGRRAYEKGDYATALKEWMASAEQGDAAAQFHLGDMYAEGKGVAQDSAEAARWYRKAADQGNAEAQYNLGLKYEIGAGVPRDNVEAVRLFRRAAEQGNPRAQFRLGGMYETGARVPQDYVEAHIWLNLAASRASGEDRKRYIKARELVAKKMNSRQIAEAQRRAREWKPKTKP